MFGSKTTIHRVPQYKSIPCGFQQKNKYSLIKKKKLLSQFVMHYGNIFVRLCMHFAK